MEKSVNPTLPTSQTIYLLEEKRTISCQSCKEIDTIWRQVVWTSICHIRGGFSKANHGLHLEPTWFAFKIKYGEYIKTRYVQTYWSLNMTCQIIIMISFLVPARSFLWAAFWSIMYICKDIPNSLLLGFKDFSSNCIGGIKNYSQGHWCY